MAHLVQARLPIRDATAQGREAQGRELSFRDVPSNHGEPQATPSHIFHTKTACPKCLTSTSTKISLHCEFGHRRSARMIWQKAWLSGTGGLRTRCALPPSPTQVQRWHQAPTRATVGRVRCRRPAGWWGGDLACGLGEARADNIKFQRQTSFAAHPTLTEEAAKEEQQLDEVGIPRGLPGA